MARRRKLEGVEARTGRDGTTRYRGSAYVVGLKINGPWVANSEEAVRWRDEQLRDAALGNHAVSTLTLSEAVQAFTKGIADGSIRNKSGRTFKPSVVRDYKRHLAMVETVVGGSVHLDRIRLPQAQVLLDRVRGQGRSDSRTRNVMAALRSLYNWAIPRGHATINPCVGLQVPVTDEQRRERIAGLSEIRLLATALILPERTAFALAAYAGLRAGEILGLDWSDVDLDLRVLRVERAFDPVEGLLIRPKSHAASRVVPLCDPLLAVLADHQDELGATGALFPGQRARRGREIPEGSRMAYTALRNHMRAAWTAAGLEPLGLHEARHTFASMLIDAGVSPKAICTYMGHASITITFDRYGHLLPGNEAEVLERLNTYHLESMKR